MPQPLALTVPGVTSYAVSKHAGWIAAFAATLRTGSTLISDACESVSRVSLVAIGLLEVGWRLRSPTAGEAMAPPADTPRRRLLYLLRVLEPNQFFQKTPREFRSLVPISDPSI